jgi:hypothetical protein
MQDNNHYTSIEIKMERNNAWKNVKLEKTSERGSNGNMWREKPALSNNSLFNRHQPGRWKVCTHMHVPLASAQCCLGALSWIV